MTYAKHLFSKFCENNVLFEAFSHIMIHRMRVSAYFFTRIKTGFLTCLTFLSTFDLFAFLIYPQKVNYFSVTFHDFPWPTLQFHDFAGMENEIIKFHDFPGFTMTREPCNKILKLILIYDYFGNTSTGSQRSVGGAYSNISWQLSMTLLWDNEAA